MVTFDTTIGSCGLRWTDVGIAEVLMPGTRGPRGERLETASSGVPDSVQQAIAGMVALLGGEPQDLRWVALDERHLDAFRRRVYAATREIAPGSTASYGEIARSIAEPRAAREVGVALAQNPFPIVVPCHRVLAATAALHGFSAPGGIATKRRMLEIERAPGFAQQALFA